jgi:hypothetical protein
MARRKALPPVEQLSLDPRPTPPQPELVDIGQDLQLGIEAIMGSYAVWVGPAPSGNIKTWGVCVGVGATRQDAIALAVPTLERALEYLQGPPPMVTT